MDANLQMKRLGALLRSLGYEYMVFGDLRRVIVYASPHGASSDDKKTELCDVQGETTLDCVAKVMDEVGDDIMYRQRVDARARNVVQHVQPTTTETSAIGTPVRQEFVL